MLSRSGNENVGLCPQLCFYASCASTQGSEHRTRGHQFCILMPVVVHFLIWPSAIGIIYLFTSTEYLQWAYCKGYYKNSMQRVCEGMLCKEDYASSKHCVFYLHQPDPLLRLSSHILPPMARKTPRYQSWNRNVQEQGQGSQLFLSFLFFLWNFGRWTQNFII